MKKLKEKSKASTVETKSKKMMPILMYLPWVLLLLLLGAAAWGYFRFVNIAVVNGKTISRLEYIKSMEKQGGKQILDHMVEEALIETEAAKNGVNIEASLIEAEISKIDEQIKSQGQTLEVALESQGMSRADLEKQIRIQKLIEKMANPETEVTQAQIDEFLATNKDQLPTGVSKEELQELAKGEISNQAANKAVTEWLAKVKESAKIIYK